MTKLGLRERQTFMEIFDADFSTISSAFTNQIQKIWEHARLQILEEEGKTGLLERKDEIDEEIHKLEQEKHEIERKIKPEDLTKEQIVELGGKLDRWGEGRDASFYGIPIKSRTEYKMVQLIKSQLNLEVPAKFLYDLNRSCFRELAMVGTFEEAQEIYNHFYKLNFRKYGVDLPPRITEMKSQSPLIETEGTKLELPSESHSTRRLISVKRESDDSQNSPHDSSTIKEEANFS